MKKIKIFILLTAVFLITGCEVNYSLEFKDGIFNEDISFSLENNSNNIETINYLKNSDQYVYYISDDDIDKINYNKTIKNNNNFVDFNYSYSYTNGLKDARVLTECFDAYSFIEEHDHYLIQTGNKFNCLVYDYMIADKINITIKTNNKVLENNADNVDGNKYMWTIDNSNFNNKPILFKVSKELNQTNFVTDFMNNMNNGSFTILFIMLVAAVMVGVIIFIVYNINKKNNAI